jgi:Sulfotransferase domain
MVAHLIAALKRPFGLHRPGRNLAVFPDDIFLVSYPKSGNTWARFLLANLLYRDHKPNWGNIDRLIPGPEVMSKRHFDHMPRPRIIRSHDTFDPRYKRVIYIVRDPRDVVLSQYHHHRKRKLIEDGYPFATFLEQFLRGETNEHGSWKQNVGSWLVARSGDPEFLLIRYEDMIANTQRELARMAKFVGRNPDPACLAESVEKSSPDEMRRLEKINADDCALTRGTRQDLSFVRAAKFGNWKSELQPADVAAIEESCAPLMKSVGYELVSYDPRTVKDLPQYISDGFIGVRIRG